MNQLLLTLTLLIVLGVALSFPTAEFVAAEEESKLDFQKTTLNPIDCLAAWALYFQWALKRGILATHFCNTDFDNARTGELGLRKQPADMDDRY